MGEEQRISEVIPSCVVLDCTQLFNRVLSGFDL
jgi:hypothetical protein